MRALPQSLVSRAELLSRSHDLQVVAAILGLHPSQMTGMKKRGWKEAIGGRPVRELPDDFIYFSNRLTFSELGAHYQAGNSTIQRWFREARNTRPSRQGEALRNDPETGRRVWQSQMDARKNQSLTEELT